MAEDIARLLEMPLVWNLIVIVMSVRAYSTDPWHKTNLKISLSFFFCYVFAVRNKQQQNRD